MENKRMNGRNGKNLRKEKRKAQQILAPRRHNFEYFLATYFLLYPSLFLGFFVYIQNADDERLLFDSKYKFLVSFDASSIISTFYTTI